MIVSVLSNARRDDGYENADANITCASVHSACRSRSEPKKHGGACGRMTRAISPGPLAVWSAGEATAVSGARRQALDIGMRIAT
jgi:hypothetical protein